MKWSRNLKALVIAGLLVVAIGGWMAGSYNALVGLRNEVDKTVAQLDSAYQRRFDLVPQLVETAKGAQIQEQKVFGDLAAARAKYSGASTSEGRVAAAGQFESALSRLLVVVENYPELKSNEVLQNLMVQLEGTENRIKVERDNYTQAVTTYNNNVQRVPRAIAANLFGFDKKEVYKATSGAEVAPNVNFTNQTTTQPAGQ